MLSEVVLVLVEVRCLGRDADARLPLGKERVLRMFGPCIGTSWEVSTGSPVTAKAWHQ